MSAVRSIVISGASSGIGRATALHLDRAGWRVFAGVRTPEDVDSLRAAGSDRLTPVRLDGVPAAAPSGARTHRPHQFGQWTGGRPVPRHLRRDQARPRGVRRRAAPRGAALRCRRLARRAGSIDTGIWDKGLDPAVRARLDPAAETLYGAGLDFVERQGRRAAENAIPVDAVVRAVDHALTARRPRRRYPVGRDAKLMIPIATHAPAVVDAVVARGMKATGA